MGQHTQQIHLVRREPAAVREPRAVDIAQELFILLRHRVDEPTHTGGVRIQP